MRTFFKVKAKLCSFNSKLIFHIFSIKSVPTLFLSECVLIYVPAENGTDIIKWSAQTFDTSCFITYEQVNPEDPYGKMMIENLQVRKISCHFHKISLNWFKETKNKLAKFPEISYS